MEEVAASLSCFGGKQGRTIGRSVQAADVHAQLIAEFLNAASTTTCTFRSRRRRVGRFRVGHNAIRTWAGRTSSSPLELR